MKETTALRFLGSCPQEQLAYAWAVAHCTHLRVSLQERHLARYRSAAYCLSTPEALGFLAEVPRLRVS